VTLTQLEVATHDVREASRYLRVPVSTLWWWLDGGERNGRHYEPVIRESATGSDVMTWGEFVEAWYVRQYRREHHVDLSDLRQLINGLREELGLRYPLAYEKPYVGPGRQLVKRVQDEIDLPQDLWMVVAGRKNQLVLTPTMTQFIERVEFDAADKSATAIRPRGAGSAIVIQPDRAGASPNVRGIRTEALVELVDAGEEIEDVARDFSLPIEELREALSYEWELQPSAA
jgi:uncharacterized protein (DUF433 family)